jgi:uncharacterized protein YpuA (DUF1002 family)
LANLSTKVQRRLSLAKKEIEAIQDATIRAYELQIDNMKLNGASLEVIRRYLADTNALINWERMQNKIRKVVANLINAVGDIGYYEGLKRGG